MFRVMMVLFVIAALATGLVGAVINEASTETENTATTYTEGYREEAYPWDAAEAESSVYSDFATSELSAPAQANQSYDFFSTENLQSGEVATYPWDSE